MQATTEILLLAKIKNSLQFSLKIVQLHQIHYLTLSLLMKIRCYSSTLIIQNIQLTQLICSFGSIEQPYLMRNKKDYKKQREFINKNPSKELDQPRVTYKRKTNTMMKMRKIPPIIIKSKEESLWHNHSFHQKT